MLTRLKDCNYRSVNADVATGHHDKCISILDIAQMYLLKKLVVGLPCLLLLIIPILAGSGLGCETAMGAVFVMVVIVAAGIIRADMT